MVTDWGLEVDVSQQSLQSIMFSSLNQASSQWAQGPSQFENKGSQCSRDTRHELATAMRCSSEQASTPRRPKVNEVFSLRIWEEKTADGSKTHLNFPSQNPGISWYNMTSPPALSSVDAQLRA